MHRLLYENYVSDIEENQYIKYNCSNKGICCNINHMYTLVPEESKKESKKASKVQNKKKSKKKDTQKIKKEKTKLIVDFD